MWLRPASCSNAEWWKSKPWKWNSLRCSGEPSEVKVINSPEKGLLSKNSFLHDSSLERCHFRGLLKYLEALSARREFGGGKWDGMWDLLMVQSLWVGFNEARCKIMAHMTGLVLQISETSLHKPTGYFILNNYVEQTSGKYTVTAQTLFNTGF